jgi:AdoMet-dependent heme synthase
MSDASLLDKWRAITAQASRPMQASLELTFRCNERCTHCYLEKFQDDQSRILTLDQWKRILRELRHGGVMYLILMGGEAMLNPHFWEIAQEASRLGFHVSMITNGQKIQTPEIAARLYATGISNITVSFYSLDPSIHDQMTSVKGSCLKTINAIELMRKAGLTVGINCLLTAANIEGYFDLADWCIERGLEIKSDPFVTPKLNGDVSPTRLRATPEQIRSFYQKLVEKWPAGKPKAIVEDKKDYVCNAAKGKCAVTPYGELLSCIEIREPLGLLIEKPFEELWNGKVANKWRNLKVGELKGRPEDESAHFCDHCPGMALHESKNPLQISSYSTEVAKIRREFSGHL